MKHRQYHPFLQFDFLSKERKEQTSLFFTDPLRVITTSSLKEVNSCLQQIEQASNAGFYLAGYFSYELTYAFNTAQRHCKINNRMPLLWFGVFHAPVNELPDSVEDGEFELGKWEMQLSRSQYQRDFKKIMRAIDNKEIEEINYTVPFEATFTGSAYRYYKQLKEAQQANYCAYFQFDQFSILSASPELFFQFEKDAITMRPMKGTVKRGKTVEEDLNRKAWLKQSEKNKLENRLTTNLMCEELEKITHKKNIDITAPYQVEQYPTVYQMTSEITGKVNDTISWSALIRALFPCGSISGVPKSESLHFIKALESGPREVYCGAMGYISPGNQAVFNVPIRTVWVDHNRQRAYYGAGGGITAQSLMKEEYEEVLAKTDVLTWSAPSFELLETMILEEHEIFLLDLHLQRLKNSAVYFNIPIKLQAIRRKLKEKLKEYHKGNWRVRLTVDRQGKSTVKLKEIKKSALYQVELAKTPIDRTHLYLYHKTTYRACYKKHQSKAPKILDVLLWNDREEITEFTIGNVVVEREGELITPPVSCGVLPGTFRQQLLDKNKIKEDFITKEELKTCTKIWLINSVRRWVEVELQEIYAE